MQQPSESQVYMNLTRDLQRMSIFEQQQKQNKARSVIPMKTLIEEASKNFPGEPLFSNPEFRDVIIIYLLTWFKTRFFTWVDCLACEVCGSESAGGKMGFPTPEETKYLAQRVEIHTCKRCGHENRFPRYNDPEKLLESRRGRCGEWANCFYLLLRALGYEARFISDNQVRCLTKAVFFYSKYQINCVFSLRITFGVNSIRYIKNAIFTLIHVKMHLTYR